MQKIGSKSLRLRCVLAAGALAIANVASAGTLNGGVFQISYDNPDDLLSGLTLGDGAITSYYVANYFDKSLADNMNVSQMLGVANDTYPAPATLSFDINPSSLAGTGIPFGSGGRNNKATTLTWGSSQDALTNSSTFTASGVAGLNGVVMTRGSFTGTLLSGDYQFGYVAARNNGVNSGWALTNNVSFSSTTYDTRNISVTTDGDKLLFTGELWYSASTSAFLFGGDGVSQAGRAGTFSLISPAPSAVPVPAAVWLFGSGLFGVMASTRRKRKAIPA
ncbi:PEP-CTERM sorting domain-containing protein [Methylomonas sp. HW2-6]|uniref:PEP-CTERM sorting domain-containing protein n=1 Tax=Methylomonas sp. HW2-6 TaxID=3376687 RepID=UPI0040420F20